MNKLPKNERRANYFKSIDRLKELHKTPRKKNQGDSRPYSRREQSERDAREAAQEAYNREQGELQAIRLRAEAAQLRKELDELFAASRQEVGEKCE